MNTITPLTPLTPLSKGQPPQSPHAIQRAKRKADQHRQLNAKHGHAQGSAEYSRKQTIRRPFVNTRHNPEGHFAR